MQPNYSCQDCSHSFFVPGGNLPTLIQGGCPECGGDSYPAGGGLDGRPERDQPPGVPSDGRLRDMPDAGGGDDPGGNPLATGILSGGGENQVSGQLPASGTSGENWQPSRKRDESFASVKRTAAGDPVQLDLHPEHRPVVDLHYPDGPERYTLHGFKRKMLPNGTLGEWNLIAEEHEPIIQRGHQFNGGDQVTGWGGPTGTRTRIPIGNLAGWKHVDGPFPHDLHQVMPAEGHGAPQVQQGPEVIEHAPIHGSTVTELVVMKHLHPQSSNTTPQMPWDFEVEEVAEDGMDNEDAKEKMEKDATQKQALFPALALGAGLLRAAAPKLIQGLGKAVPGMVGGEALGQAGEMLGMGGGQPAAPAQAPAGGYYTAGNLPGGGTPDEGPKNTEDPEEVDPKEHNDGEDRGLPNDNSVDVGAGSTMNRAEQPPVPEEPATPGLEALEMLMPLIMHYNDAPEEDGTQHPLLQPLIQLLTEEGHLDHPGDDNAHQQVLLHFKGGGDSEGQAEHNPAPQDAGQPDDSDEPSEKKEAANHQGPHNDEQVAAVQQYLVDQGRQSEADLVRLAPWKYADELAQVINQPAPPDDDGLQAPQPAQEEAPPEATMPMPGMSAPPLGGATARVAADNMAPKCPQCGSHTTGVATDDGDARCHACGNVWAAGGSSAGEQFVTSAEHGDPAAEGNPVNVPSADQQQPQDLTGDQDGSHQWQTDDGQPLATGQMYELHTPGVAVPDVVRVTAIKPNAIELEFTGAYELGFSKEITRQEFDLEHYTFAQVQGGNMDPSPQNDMQDTPNATYDQDFTGPGQGSDLSSHNTLAHVAFHIVEAAGPGTGVPGPAPMAQTPPAATGAAPGPAGACQKCGGPLDPTTGGCNGCESSAASQIGPQQNGMAAPATAPGMAAATPGLPGAPGTAPPSSPSMPPNVLNPEQQQMYAHLLGNAANDHEGDTKREASFDLDEVIPDPSAGPADWLNDGTWAPKTAGAHFSPSQQRELIDEDGTARNADKLDLGNTHYEARRALPEEDSFLW